ncbi:ABC-type transporter ATP-binding protein EcsA [Dermatophilus congolensis]|uniref:ABC-type transporter ATP-binding protein EcsA n=1 Tax=Dermatophilus congolensis TaxID=1863 RepID=A0AA46H018_9MICO|nr:ABC transporter ATP-binding protein [Dermatophilus congolensis]STD07145.1 ABC-type transporter ATP-binding protein EcsA [Dermatophilus congolensis]
MPGRSSSLIEDYSHGMRKKAQIISAVLLARPLTIIDETFNGIDLEAQRAAEKWIKKLNNSGAAFLVCSHDFSMLENLTQRIWVLKNGKNIETLNATHIATQKRRLRDVIDELVFEKQ